MAANSRRPRKRPNRTSATAASVPKSVAMKAEMKATRKLIDAAWRSAASCASTAYQRIDQPPQTATSRATLKADSLGISIALHAAHGLMLKKHDRRDQKAD